MYFCKYCGNASVNSTCAQLPPPPPGLPPGISIFLALDGKFPGVGILDLSCQIPRGGDEKRGQMPRPSSKVQHFSLISQSNSAILSTLMCGFFFCFNERLPSNSARILIKTHRDDMHQFTVFRIDIKLLPLKLIERCKVMLCCE